MGSPFSAEYGAPTEGRPYRLACLCSAVTVTALENNPHEVTKKIMKRVTGIGGVFFKAKDPEKLRTWYQKHLGLEFDTYGSAVFDCPADEEQQKTAKTVWSLFPIDTKYFDPSSAPFMINYRVENLAALLAQLRSEGVTVDERVEEHEYGRFGWLMDPEGNRIELWEPDVPFTKDSGEKVDA